MKQFRLGQVTVDLERARIDAPWGHEPLRPLEARLLAYLARRAPEVVSNEALLTEVWGYAAGTRTRTVGITVGRLRKKLEPDGPPRHLITIHGAGYQLVGVEPADGPHAELVRSLHQAVRGGRRLLVLTGEGRQPAAEALAARLGDWRSATDGPLSGPGVVLWHDPPASQAAAIAAWVASDAGAVALITAEGPLGLQAETVVQVPG